MSELVHYVDHKDFRVILTGYDYGDGEAGVIHMDIKMTLLKDDDIVAETQIDDCEYESLQEFSEGLLYVLTLMELTEGTDLLGVK